MQRRERPPPLIAVLAIYLAAVLLFLTCGVVVNAALSPGGRWLSLRTLPLGAGAALALLYWLGYFMATSRAVWVFLGILVVGAAIVVALRIRAIRAAPGRRELRWRAALVPDLPDAVATAVGIAAGALLLAPLLRLGFPTTIAYSNNDGWAYVSNIDYLRDHAFGPPVIPDIEEPSTFSPFAQLRDGFGVGFELLCTALMQLLRRQPYEMVNAVSAIGIPLAVTGWACVWKAVTGRLELRHVGFVGIGAVSPVFLLPYTENYTPQFVSLSLLPFAMASAVWFARNPSVRTAVPAALGSGAVLGVYPPMAPWLLPPVILAALVGARWPVDRAGWRDVRSHPPRLGRTVVLLLGLGAALLVLVPIQLRHTLRWFTVHDQAAAPIPFPRLDPDEYIAFGSGASAPFSYITGSPVPWSVAAVAILVVPVLAAGLLLPLRRAERGRRALLPLAAGAVGITAVAIIAFAVSDPLGYGIYKSAIAGCSLVAGLAVLGLIPRERGDSPVIRTVAIGVLVAAWIPVSAQLVQLTETTSSGFRAADIELGRVLDGLPGDPVVLVAGAAEEPGSFQVRMVGSYFGTSYAGLPMEGLGSTSSYITPGGLPEWTPDRAWDYVITIRKDPAPFGRGRRLVWSNATYSLWRAPALDATPFAPTWYPAERDREGAFHWTAGDVQIVVSNRTASERRAVLRLTATSHAGPRTLTMTAAGSPARVIRLEGSTRTPVAMPLTLPADSAVAVTLASTPGPVAAPPPDPRRLSLRLQDIGLQSAR